MTTLQQASVSAAARGRDLFNSRCLKHADVERIARETFASVLEQDSFVGGWNIECWQRWGRGPNG